MKTELSLRHGLQLILKQVEKLAANPLHLVATPLLFRIPFFTAEASTQDVFQWEISKSIEDWTISFNVYRNHQLSDDVTCSQSIKINAESIPTALEIIHHRFKDLVLEQDQIYRYQLEAINHHPISRSGRSLTLYIIYLRQTPVSVKPKPRFTMLSGHVKRLATLTDHP